MSQLTKLIGRSSRPLPKLDLGHPLVIELSEALQALDALPLSTEEERAQWSDAAQAFERKLRTDWSSVYDSLPHELEHYLDDADIRAKDASYTSYQRKLLAPLLAPQEPIQSIQHNAGSRPPPNDSPASESPSAPAPRG